MRRLLLAHLLRIRKSRLFWGMMFFVILNVVYEVYIMPYKVFDTGKPYASNEVLFYYVRVIHNWTLFFCSLFIGMEYQNGTIRNKIMAGHRRKDIYLANLVVCTTAMYVMILIHILASCLIAMTALKWGDIHSFWYQYTGPAPTLPKCIALILCSLFTTAVYSAVFTMLSMQNSNVTFSLILNYLIGRLVMVYGGGWLGEWAIGGKSRMVWGGFITWIEEKDGIYLLDRLSSSLVNFLIDCLPYAQTYRIYYYQFEHLPHVAVCSTVLVCVVTALGICLFEKKKLR